MGWLFELETSFLKEIWLSRSKWRTSPISVIFGNLPKEWEKPPLGNVLVKVLTKLCKVLTKRLFVRSTLLHYLRNKCQRQFLSPHVSQSIDFGHNLSSWLPVTSDVFQYFLKAVEQLWTARVGIGNNGPREMENQLSRKICIRCGKLLSLIQDER